MTLIRLPRGFIFPDHCYNRWDLDGAFGSSAIDATGEKYTVIGYVHLEANSGSKVISAAGGGSIGFRTSSCTFANGATTVDVGIQDVTAGPPIQPDGSFDVKITLTGGGGGIVTTAWNTVSMTGGTGTKTIADGDLIAVVFDMTARGGADAVNFNGPGLNDNTLFPLTLLNTGVWAAANRWQGILITFDDGTHGLLEGALPFSTGAEEGYMASTNPDERGMKWTQPFTCKVDGFWGAIGNSFSADGDLELKLYSDPLGTPALVDSIVLDGGMLGDSTTVRASSFSLGNEVDLIKGTVYGLTMLATGTANAEIRSFTMGSTAWNKFSPAGTTFVKISRNDSTGAFTAESPALTMYAIAVRVSQIDDGDGTGGGGGGGLRLAGHGGLAA